jgi:acetyl-CoA acetyltransferase
MVSSQLTDGAAATLLMTRREAVRRGLPILGVFRSFAAVGVDPSIMGIGPAVAIPEVRGKLGGLGTGGRGLEALRCFEEGKGERAERGERRRRVI